MRAFGCMCGTWGMCSSTPKLLCLCSCILAPCFACLENCFNSVWTSHRLFMLL